MLEFLQAAESEVDMLQSGMKQVDAIRIKLADFYCEDPVTFKMEECLKIFQSFCEKFKQAVKENEKRRIQEEQAVIRRKQREEQMAKRARQSRFNNVVCFLTDVNYICVCSESMQYSCIRLGKQFDYG